MPTSLESPAADRPPPVVSELPQLRGLVADLRRAGKRLGLVPTMGALHAGHISLVRASVAECDATLVTIFVNPTQFGPHEDFARYPRDLSADLQLLAGERATAVFAPATDDMYPAGASTSIEPPHVAGPLEGVCRPGHFRGVATVVLKLFQLIPADVAYFGQKDFQQCRVIEQMAADLNVPIEIRRCPIVRDEDGLALSSRNQYLSRDERARAVAISRCLAAGRERILAGERGATVIRSAMNEILAASGITRTDYVAVADPVTLRDQDRIELPVMLLVAAHVGRTRLIDNCLVDETTTEQPSTGR
jgi:pantoate--beta-alanine ligase